MLRAAYENQQEPIRATMAFVDRFRYKATKARQVQSRLKQLDKIERIEMDDEQGSISFDFPPPPSPGRILMELEGVTKAYGPVPVFQDLDLTIERGDRIAFLGVNGAGKSTLARIIAGLEPIQARDAHARPQRDHLLLRPAPGRRARPDEDRARRRSRTPPRPGCSRACARCSAASCSPATTSSSASPCSPAARRAGSRWPRCS